METCWLQKITKGLCAAITAVLLTVCVSGCDLGKKNDTSESSRFTLTSKESSAEEPLESSVTYSDDDLSDASETDSVNSSVLSEAPQSITDDTPEISQSSTDTTLEAPQSSADTTPETPSSTDTTSEISQSSIAETIPEPSQSSTAPEASDGDISASSSAPASSSSSTTDEDIPYSPAHTVTDGIELVSMTNPLKRNEDAELTIKGIPNTEYFIYVYYSSGKSTAAGLESKTSDNEGYVTWTWHVGGRTKLGDNKRVEVSGGGQKLSTTFSVVN